MACSEMDFLARLNSLFSSNLNSAVPNLYILRSNNLLYYFCKWLRNYSDSVPYQKVAAQSHAFILLFGSFILILSFMWNWIIAGWNESFPLYFANITKYIFSFMLSAYILYRGIYLPAKKGCFLRGRCNVFDLFVILFVSLFLDLAKSLGSSFIHLLVLDLQESYTRLSWF